MRFSDYHKTTLARFHIDKILFDGLSQAVYFHIMIRNKLGFLLECSHLHPVCPESEGQKSERR
ncbi:hypothetical protein B8V81_0077 [Paenibacillus pasadenensis]|uniref:Uncharacterized protein n=1 Tax=Paenibacillus pasadenensis TaxID=217090 RepID=A0A2N5NC86_9BACL|nr:hypothetical protein B8V81_0077 [Paenibacillus pasadenensis]